MRDSDMQLLILTGQARSGSTLLARLMNDGNRAAIVNDAYFIQFVDSVTDTLEVNEAQAKKICSEFLEIIRARSDVKSPPRIDKSVILPATSYVSLSRYVESRYKSWKTWPEIVEGILQILGNTVKAEAYGWNTPPDFTHAERLFELFPESRMVMLIRDPFSVLLSYKNLPEYWGTERNRYNPLLQALVWRQMLKRYETLVSRYPGRIHLVRYEDLVADPVAVMDRLSAFAGVSFARPDLKQTGSNSSHAAGDFIGLSRVEIFICDVITRSMRGIYGYGCAAVPVANEWGIVDLARCAWRSASYYTGRVIASRDMRNRVFRFAKNLVSSQ